MFQKDDDDEDDDSGDENSPYARIDKLRRQILGGKGKANTLAPPDTGVSGGRPLSISEQMFSLPRANKPAPSLTVPDLYDSVEEVPSPFLDYDMVSQSCLSCGLTWSSYVTLSRDLSRDNLYGLSVIVLCPDPTHSHEEKGLVLFELFWGLSLEFWEANQNQSV